MLVIREIEPGEGELVAEVLRELRSHLSAADIPALIDGQRSEGYRVVACFTGEEVSAVAGFRVSNNLALGRNLYIDDLVTRPSARNAGHARALLRWIATEAQRLGCSYVHLDSGTHRHPAHRLYASEGYDITSFHFGQSTPP